MRTPNIDDVVAVAVSGGVERAKVVRSYKKRFIVGIAYRAKTYVAVGHEGRPAEYTWSVTLSFERHDENKTWCRGWDTEDAIAWRAERALASCR